MNELNTVFGIVITYLLIYGQHFYFFSFFVFYQNWNLLTLFLFLSFFIFRLRNQSIRHLNFFFFWWALWIRIEMRGKKLIKHECEKRKRKHKKKTENHFSAMMTGTLSRALIFRSIFIVSLLPFAHQSWFLSRSWNIMFSIFLFAFPFLKQNDVTENKKKTFFFCAKYEYGNSMSFN